MNSPNPATAHTAAEHARCTAHLDFTDRADFERANRGWLAALDPPVIDGPGSRPLWDLGTFRFLDDERCPPEVNPSLWRQARINCAHGLFEVTPGIYQVRGYDISNITFVRSDTGWIVIDPLTVAETAAAARQLVDKHFGARPIVAVIYTHSHLDHFGGVRGIVTDTEVATGSVQIIAPQGFMEAAVSENVIAGPAMRRRAMYMFGVLLPSATNAHVDSGLGKRTPFGTSGLIAPTTDIAHTGETLTIDGITIEFQLTPGTEAPAEMNFYFPQMKALCMAENCNATMHNLYTPRGAEIRDALGWSRYINESLELFLDRTDVAFASHHWPRWGSTDIEKWLCGQRDLYRYLHDETMRLANHGLTAGEIAEEIEVPPKLAGEWFNRGYYGTVNHNVKAIYQKYLGWFDANPANLHPHPPVATAQRMVRYMGGAEAALAKANQDYAAGDYRWVAQVCNHLVFADPSDTAARLLQADALEQLGYQTESAVWRGFYLTGAQELRNGTPRLTGARPTASADTMRAMTPQMVLDLCAVKLNGPRAIDEDLQLEFHFDDGWTTRVAVTNGVVNYGQTRPREPDAIITTTSFALASMAHELTTLADEIATNSTTIDGNVAGFQSFLGLLDQFELFFAIIEP
ncbi:MAG: MBL fold metallo-hydrolase [Actinobacteria bacterium]|nr:MBL fold metallo-hydrolase [Actinomycetota bacterium]